MGDCKKVQFCIQAPVGMEGTVPYLCTYRLFIFLSVELKKKHPGACNICSPCGCLTHPKVWGAGGEYDPVCPDELTVSGQRDVHQALLLQQHVHHGQDRRAVVVPLEAKLLSAAASG